MMIDTNLLIAMGAAYKKVAAGEIIFRENTQANFYHQLESGSVRWVNIDDDGNEFIQALVSPGECFGEMPLFDNEPYAATAIAEKDSVIIRLHHTSFHQMLMDNPGIYISITKLLSQRLRYKFLMNKEAAAHNPEHTIATLLNHFKKEKNHLCPDCHQLKLTRQQLAGMTGMRVETVIRTMRVMHDKGALRIEKGRVFC
jgi:CRP-like cAMP-binding protein